jgi:ECF sigma factor
MTELTRILNAISVGESALDAELVTKRYGELHQMAIARLHSEKNSSALQPTEQIADILEVSPRTAQGIWSYARAWLRERMKAN